MNAFAASVLYMSVSVTSLTIQLVALARIVVQRRRRGAVARRGLVRTAGCRVAASTAYVALGIAALMKVWGTEVVGLLVLLCIQVMWQVNALLDARLSGRLAQPIPRHRKE